MITVKNEAFFSDIQYGFRTSCSTVDLLIVVSDHIKIALKVFNKRRVTTAVTLITHKVFARV